MYYNLVYYQQAQCIKLIKPPWNRSLFRRLRNGPAWIWPLNILGTEVEIFNQRSALTYNCKIVPKIKSEELAISMWKRTSINPHLSFFKLILLFYKGGGAELSGTLNLCSYSIPFLMAFVPIPYLFLNLTKTLFKNS